MNDEGAEHGRPVEVADRARREQCSGRASHMYEYATNCPEDDRGNVTAHRLGVATALVDGEWVAGDVVVDDGVIRDVGVTPLGSTAPPCPASSTCK